MIYDCIADTVGNTPIVRLGAMAPDHVDMYVKVEAFNPTGSVKDRLAYAIIDAAEKSGELKPGQTVIEATSGNTGIGLAMVCASKGYPFVAVMADSFSVERRQIMRALGAKVILTPAAEKGSGMVRRTVELAEKHGWFHARQFKNPANPAFHRNTTGPEILTAFMGRRLDYWVSGWGTGGTMTGAGQALKLARPDIKIIVTESELAPLLSGGEFSSHKIQGWGPDFIPEVLDQSVYDEIRLVSDEDARDAALRLAKEEGIFAGISSGGALSAALAIAAEAEPGSSILTMLPDTGERYLSTYLFEDLDEGSDDDWLAGI